MEMGDFCIGVGIRGTSDLDKQLSQRQQTWCLPVTADEYKVGDVLGCSYDMSGVKSLLRFYHNGILLDKTISGVKGEVFPCFSVGGGANLAINFGQDPFEMPPEEGFEGVIFSMDMI